MRPLSRWASVRPGLRPALRRMAPWLLPVLAGALLFALAGTVPSRLDRAGASASGWALPGLPDRSAAADEAASVWTERRPWGGAPAEDAGAAAVPVPVPVAIVSTRSGHEAVFVIPGAGEIRARAGDSLPDGGRVEQVDALSVAWTDGQGQRQEQRLLADPPRPLAPPP